MRYDERPAPPELTGIVTRLWFLEAPPLRRFEKILPMPFVHLIVNLSDPYRLFDRAGAATTVADAFVSGLQSEFLVIESPPLIRHVGVELAPAGLHALAPHAAATSAGRVQDARDVLEGVDGLVAALRECAGAAEVLDAAEAYLRRFDHGTLDPLVARALDAIQADPDTPISVLARRFGVSHKTLIARCRTATGTTPKSHAQILRFHRLLDALQESEGAPDWARLAAASGYYDQPHVIRAFRRFSGWTPAEYQRLVAEHGPEAALFVPLDQVPIQARA